MDGSNFRSLISAICSFFLLSVVLVPFASAQEEEAEPTSGYHKGFFIQSEDGDFRMRTRARIQSRYQFDSLDAGDEDREMESAFSLPRARLKIQGHAFSSDIDYSLQLDFGKGYFGLKDFYVDYAVSDNFHVRVGQFKRPFSRQQLTSSSSLVFVDRTLTDKEFGAGRDIGVMIHNNFTKSPSFEWAIGVFNGTGDKGTFSGDADVTGVADQATGEVTASGDVSGKFSNVPDMFNPTLVMRVGYNHGALKGYSEADLEGGEFRFGVGASARMDFDMDEDDDAAMMAELDYTMKISGFANSGGVYMGTVQDGDGMMDQTLDAIGFHTQASYVINDYAVPSVRYALIDPEGDANNSSELSLGLSSFFEGHSLKLQTDFAMLTDEESETTDYRARTQLQLSF